MNAHNILDDPAAPRRARPFADEGAIAVAILTATLFVAPMVFWALKASAPTSSKVAAGFELRMLLWTTLLGLLLPLIQIFLQIRRFGGAAVRGNRARFLGDEGVGGRVARAHRNLIENLVPFASAVLAAHMLALSTPWTVAASAMFLGARLVHAVTYALGVTVLRSAAFYASVLATVILTVQCLIIIPF